MSTAHFTDNYLVLCTLRNSLLCELWVFWVIWLRLPSLAQRVIHCYSILPLLNDEISLSTNFREYIYCELLSIFYCDLLGWWNNGGSNGSLFWMGHVGHGSVHVDPWPTIISSAQQVTVKYRQNFTVNTDGSLCTRLSNWSRMTQKTHNCLKESFSSA